MFYSWFNTTGTWLPSDSSSSLHRKKTGRLCHEIYKLDNKLERGGGKSPIDMPWSGESSSGWSKCQATSWWSSVSVISIWHTQIISLGQDSPDAAKLLLKAYSGNWTIYLTSKPPEDKASSFLTWQVNCVHSTSNKWNWCGMVRNLNAAAALENVWPFILNYHADKGFLATRKRSLLQDIQFHSINYSRWGIFIGPAFFLFQVERLYSMEYGDIIIAWNTGILL